MGAWIRAGGELGGRGPLSLRGRGYLPSLGFLGSLDARFDSYIGFKVI